MRMSSEPLKAWLILKTNGSITAGHCNCMAGLAECCSHVAAIAFVLQFASNDRTETLACTDKLSQWTVPSLSKKPIEPKMMKDVNWGSSITTKAYNGNVMRFYFQNNIENIFRDKIN